MKRAVPLCTAHWNKGPWLVDELADELERLGVVWVKADDTTGCVLCTAAARMYDLDLSASKPAVVTTVIRRRRGRKR